MCVGKNSHNSWIRHGVSTGLSVLVGETRDITPLDFASYGGIPRRRPRHRRTEGDGPQHPSRTDRIWSNAAAPHLRRVAVRRSLAA